MSKTPLNTTHVVHGVVQPEQVLYFWMTMPIMYDCGTLYYSSRFSRL